VSFASLMRRRRMTRSFRQEPVEHGLLVELLDTARRVPSAGSSQGFDFLVLEGAEQVSEYWDATLTASRRPGFRWQGLLKAPVLVLVYADADAYLRRYAEHDKATTGLGDGRSAWSTPYWLVDASFAALALQLAAIEKGLGVLFFGVFDHKDAVAEVFGVPDGVEVVGAIAIGWPAEDEPGRSAGRSRRPVDESIHWGRW
jgi:nitroreductase